MIKKAFNTMAYGFKIVPEIVTGASIELLVKMKNAGFVALNGIYDSVTPKQPALIRATISPKKPSGMR